MFAEISKAASFVGTSVQDLWATAETCSQHVGYSLYSSRQIITDNVQALIENRGGLANLVGLLIVPSQFACSKAQESNETIDYAASYIKAKIEKFHLKVNSGNTTVSGIIYYPEGWDQSDTSLCVVYHNPNLATTAKYFDDGDLSHVPGELLELTKCPIIMYDYRGTGLSSDNTWLDTVTFHPTYESIVADGEAVLKYAFSKFDFVKIVGTSLGGGVATVALDRHLLKENLNDATRTDLVNHDSFSTTPRVIIPNNHDVADCLGGAVGGLLDAETSMKNLIDRNVPIVILCQRHDFVIREGARMAETVENLPPKQNVSIIDNQGHGHGNLSNEMLSRLNKVWKTVDTQKQEISELIIL